MTTHIRVAVGVLTYCRPEMLKTLIPALQEQFAALPATTTAQILIVDNDPEGSARSAVPHDDDTVRYVHEPTPGIAAARATAMATASEQGFTMVQFIDDDELPSPNWLAIMVDAWQSHDHPAAVAGPVLPDYQQPPSPWIEAGRFFVRARHRTGTPLPAAPCGNLLLDLTQVNELGVTFDARLGLRGGEDTLFTRELVRRGGRIIFCNEAPVLDRVPAARATRSWVLTRAWHHGATHAFTVITQAGSGRSRVVARCRLALGGTIRACAGLAKAAMGTVTRNLAVNAQGWRLAYRGAGIVTEAVSGTPPEYLRSEDN